MLQHDDVKDNLEHCKEIFSKKAIDCIESMFQIECSINSAWSVTERISGEFDHNISVGNGNETYQGIMAIGLNTSELESFFQYDQIDYIIDVFGEFANTYIGMLMDESEFTDRFGILTQAIPQYTQSKIYYPRAWACAGTIINDQGKPIYIGYALRKLTFRMLNLQER